MGTDRKINRREALKCLGLLTLGTAAAASGLFVPAGCSERPKRRIIFYFTGTGNCLHVARELADAHTELLSIPQMIRRERYDFEADEIGIVYPIYGHMPPYMVRQFVERARLKASYRFAVLTYGARKCNAVEIWDDIARRAGNAFDYVATLLMVDNWLPNFDMNRQMKIDKRIPEQLERISGDIGRRVRMHESVTEEERRQHEGFMRLSGLDPETGFLKRSERCFVVAPGCVDCGICVDVCPRGNYALTSQGVRTQGDCEFCFACIQNYPQKAIRFAPSDDPLLARSEVNPDARYRDEHVSLMDLKRANGRL